MKKLLAVAMMVFLSACATFGQNANTAKLGVTYATLKYIEKAGDPVAQAERAADVRRVAEDVRVVASGEAVTVAALEAAALAQLPDSLSPADRFLATALIQAAVAELQVRVGEGVLDPEKKLQVEAVLAWVVEATNYFVP